MKLRSLLFMVTLLLCCLGVRAQGKDDVRQRPVPQTINFVTDEEVYLYNIGAGQFFTQGNSWGTQASVGSEPRKVKFLTNTSSDYIMQCYCWRSSDEPGGYMTPTWREVFFDSETALFVDRASQANYFFTVAQNADGTIRLSSSANDPDFNLYAGTKFLGVPKTKNEGVAINSFLLPEEGLVDWAVISIEDYNALSEQIAIYNKAQGLKVWIDKIKAINGDYYSLESVYLDETSSMSQIESAISSAKPIYDQARHDYAVSLINNAPEKNNIDITIALVNPDFEESKEYERNTTGWTTEYTLGTHGTTNNLRTGGTSTNLCYESWQMGSFDVYQEIKEMPAGVYEIEVQGFYRYKYGDNEGWNAYQAQQVEYVKDAGVPVYVYMNNNQTPFSNIYKEPVPVNTLYQSSSYGQAYTDPNNQYWYPNEMYNSAAAFEAGMYKRSAYGLVSSDGETLRLGVKGSTDQSNGSWCIWDNFKLRYRGFQPDVVQPVLETAMTDLQQYSNLLMGRTEYAKLSSAMTEAQSSIANQDGEAMFKALNALYDVKETVIASKDLFLEQDVAADTLRLSNSISDFETKKISAETLQRAKSLLNSIVKNQQYENNQISQMKMDVDAIIEDLSYSYSQYSSLANYIKSLQTKIEEVSTIAAGQEIKESASTLYSRLIVEYENGDIADNKISDEINNINSMIERLDKIHEYISDSEWAILHSAYLQMTNTEKWYRKWNFDAEEHVLGNVPGVEQINGNIISINLSDNNMTGVFPYGLLSLPYLEKINISGNSLSGDIGTSTAVYAKQNPTRMLALKDLDISGNQFSGNIGIFANCFPNLTSLNASDNCLEDVYPMIPTTVTTLDISKQTISRVVPLDLSNLSAMSLATKMPSILLYNHGKRTFTTNINLYGTTLYDSFGMTMSYQNGKFAIPYISEQNTYYGNSSDTLNVAVVNNEGMREGSTFRITLSFDEGDCNFDGNVDVLDLQTDILYIMEEYQSRPFNFTAVNLWKDDKINVQDVICHVNMLLNNEAVDDEYETNARGASRLMAMDDAELEICDGKLLLSSNKPVAAFDITINGTRNINVAKSLEQKGMTVSKKELGNGVRIIGYSLNGACIPAGLSTICSLDKSSTVRKAMLSDVEANAISVSCGSTITDIKTIDSIPVNNFDIYDIQGRKVNGMYRKGIYIQNGRKIMK